MASSPRLSETGRLEAFSDGVFAIVLTLLVLDLLPGDGPQGFHELFAAWPRYLAFLTAFVTVSSIWLNHHNASTRLRRVDPRVLVINLVLLRATTLTPWPTALIAEAVGSGRREDETAAVLAYSLVTVLVGGAWTVLYRSLAGSPELLRSSDDVPWMRRFGVFSMGSIIVALVGGGLAFVLPIASVVLYLIVPAVFVVVTLFERDTVEAESQPQG